MNEPVPEFKHDNQRRTWERGWYASDGVRVARCPYSGCEQAIKPVSKFVSWTAPLAKATYCHDCNRKNVRKVRERGLEVKEQLLTEAGGCMWLNDDGTRCHMRYPRDHRGNFTLDHIDASLKEGDHETRADWIVSHEQEFFERVRPNLQVLCCHHNRIKASIEQGVGGILHVNPWEREDDGSDNDTYYDDFQLVIPGLELGPNPLT